MRKKETQNKQDYYSYKHSLKKKFGITPEYFEKMFEAQGKRCAVCGTYKNGKSNYRFCVDHDHKTGKIRGVLCIKCNVLIGQSDDNVQTLQNAIDYLSKG